MPLVENAAECRYRTHQNDYSSHIYAWCQHRQKLRARGLLCYTPVVAEFPWRSSETHTVRRTGFPLTHAHYLTSTASQGQTIRTGVTIDCARIEPQGARGTKDAEWWLHLYVMFSRATCLADMLLLRPPPRALLEKGATTLSPEGTCDLRAEDQSDRPGRSRAGREVRLRTT